MLKPEQGFSPVNDLITGYDLIIIMQMIDKLLQHGLVSGKEVAFIAGLRQKAHAGLQEFGVDLDIEQQKQKQGE